MYLNCSSDCPRTARRSQTVSTSTLNPGYMKRARCLVGGLSPLGRNRSTRRRSCCWRGLPEDGDRVVRVLVAAPVGVQLDLGVVAVPVHVRHVLPRLVIVLGDHPATSSPSGTPGTDASEASRFPHPRFVLTVPCILCGILRANP